MFQPTAKDAGSKRSFTSENKSRKAATDFDKMKNNSKVLNLLFHAAVIEADTCSSKPILIFWCSLSL